MDDDYRKRKEVEATNNLKNKSGQGISNQVTNQNNNSQQVITNFSASVSVTKENHHQNQKMEEKK